MNTSATPIAPLLAERAIAASKRPVPDHLRTLVLTDIAAFLGADANGLVADIAEVCGLGPGRDAMCGAARMHIRTQDDFDPVGRVHLGVATIPAAVAVGRGELWGPLMGSYEVTALLSEAYTELAQSRGLRPTSVFGPIGAAVAACLAIGADSDVLTSAIAMASVGSCGTMRSWIDGTDEWLLEVGWAVRSGVEAALLAARGGRGSTRALDGRASWAHAYFDDEHAIRLRDALAWDTDRIGRVAAKLYPVSGISQAPTAAAIQLAGSSPISITVRMSPDELSYPGVANRGPFIARSDSLMSVVRAVALATLHGYVPSRALDRRPDNREETLLQHIDVVADPEIPDGVALLSADNGDRVVDVTVNATDVLYPSLGDLLGDLPGLARRTEAPLPALQDVVGLLTNGADISEYRRVLFETMRS